MSDRQQKIDKLLRFLQRPSHNGGVYLISGQRGVGKTTLVETALDQNRGEVKPNPCRAYFSGRIGRRTPLQVVRQPRGLKRTLLKVDVDPMLPIENPDATNEAQDEVTRYTRLLLLNICFALTNAIDSHFSIRRHGRVLRERMGFFRYWLGDAMLWPGNDRKRWSLKLAYAALIVGAYFLWFEVMPCIYPTLPCWMRWLGFGILSLSPIGASLWLRWLDWRALQNISASLYDLAHANQFQQDHDETRDTQREGRMNWSWVLSILLLLGLVWLIVPKDWLTGLYDAFSAHSASTSPDKNVFQLAPTVFRNLLALLLPVILILTLTYSARQKSHNGSHAQYGKDKNNKPNPAWMINLLRRYLFLCHRCGLEPVLVLDELDKLDDLDEFADKAGESKPKRFTPAKPAKPDRMNIFLLALSRLKASLGAEFVWILIGGPKIHDKLQQNRHERLDGNLGLLATVIHQEEVLGPMALETAENYMLENWQKDWDEQAIEYKWARKIDGEQHKVLWLRSYGNFSTLVRECENIKAPFYVTDFQKSLIAAVVELWPVENINNFLAFEYTPEVLDAVRDEWVYIWMRSGILDAGNHLIKPVLPDRAFFLGLSQLLDERDAKAKASRNLRTLDEIHAIKSAEPTLLRAAGAMILYRYLKQTHLIRDTRDHIEIVSRS